MLGAIRGYHILLTNTCMLQFGQTALHWASWNGHLAVVNILIANNADVHVTGNVGITVAE